MANFQVPENINFPAEEDKIGDYWKEIKAFQVLPSIEYDELLILLIIILKSFFARPSLDPQVY